MAARKDAVIIRYPDGQGYLLRLPDGSEFESDTVPEAIAFAHAEGCTRVYSTPVRFVLIGREEVIAR